jgi:hypothetical protein
MGPALALALVVAARRVNGAPLFGNGTSRPPDHRDVLEQIPGVPPGLPPAVEDDVRRLLKAADGLREKADELRAFAEDLRSGDANPQVGKQRDEAADDLDDRAEALEEKALRYEDDADQLIHEGKHASP